MRRFFNTRLLIAVACVLAGLGSTARAALVISDSPTKNMNCGDGVCTATAADAVMNAKDLKRGLVVADLKIVSGSAAQDIVFNTKFQWTKKTRLTLDAYRSITFNFAVVAEGTGAVTLITNDGGTGGDYSFTDKGKLTFWDASSSLIINGATFTLVNDIATLATGLAANPGGSFALTNYYDASGALYTASPIDFLGGTFEGLGHVIANLAIHNKGDEQRGASKHNKVGLFFFAGNGSVIRDVHLTNVNIVWRTGKLAYVGSLLGYGQASIVNSSSQGSIAANGPSAVGGLAGFADGDIINSAASVEISIPFVPSNLRRVRSEPYVGGLVGEEYGSIRNSHASGTIIGGTGDLVGGLAGWANSVSNSYATTTVSVPDSEYQCTEFDHHKRHAGSFAGGLVGFANSIQQSFATGPVIGGRETVLGGLAGMSFDVVNSYSTGSVQGGEKSCVGGLMGLTDPFQSNFQVSSSYSIGSVSGSELNKRGGIVGFDRQRGTFASTCWDLDTSGITDPTRGAGNPKNDPGIAGLSDAQLKSGLPSGFDSAVWAQSPDVNNGYPYLLSNPPPPPQ